jgi:hypothetical protein
MQALFSKLLVTVCCLIFAVAAYGQNCDAGFTANSDGCNVFTFTPNTMNGAFIYSWVFEDGGTSSEMTPTHTFFVDAPGTYQFNVTLAVNGSCIPDTVTQTINVIVDSLPDPSISSGLLPEFVNCGATNDNPNFTLQINNTSSTEATNTFYEVDWGDGTSHFSGPNIPTNTSHNYTEVGLFNIVLTVTGDNGCVQRDTFEFFNGSNPGVSIGNAGNTIACIPEIVAFPIGSTDNNVPGTIHLRCFFRTNSLRVLAIQNIQI